MGIINSLNFDENEDIAKYKNLTKKLTEIESKLTDYEMFKILSCGKNYANNFCDLICQCCWDFKIFENPGDTKAFFSENFGEKFVEFISSSEFFRVKSQMEKDKEEKEEKEDKENYKKTLETDYNNNTDTDKDEKEELIIERERENLKNLKDSKNTRNFDLIKFDPMKIKFVIFLFTNDNFILQDGIENNYNDKVGEFTIFYHILFKKFFYFFD